jgi:hypothetical protein
VKDTLPSLGSDVLMISLDTDTSEDAALLARFADEMGFSWRFALSPKEVLAQLAAAFGTEFLTQPSEPMFLIDAKGATHALPFGHKSADQLRRSIQQFRV